MDIDMLHKYTHMRVDAPSYFINCGNLNYLDDQLIINYAAYRAVKRKLRPRGR